jgi:hypothetical protein
MRLRSRHINIKYYHTREFVANKITQIENVDGNDQLADILTKPLSDDEIGNLRKCLLGWSTSAFFFVFSFDGVLSCICILKRKTQLDVVAFSSAFIRPAGQGRCFIRLVVKILFDSQGPASSLETSLDRFLKSA